MRSLTCSLLHRRAPCGTGAQLLRDLSGCCGIAGVLQHLLDGFRKCRFCDVFLGYPYAHIPARKMLMNRLIRSSGILYFKAGILGRQYFVLVSSTQRRYAIPAFAGCNTFIRKHQQP